MQRTVLGCNTGSGIPLFQGFTTICAGDIPLCCEIFGVNIGQGQVGSTMLTAASGQCQQHGKNQNHCDPFSHGILSFVFQYDSYSGTEAESQENLTTTL